MSNETSKQDYEVGFGKPPKENQFQPGQSGNPNGTPPSRCNLWRWICHYMDLTDTEIAKLGRAALTQAQKTALKMVKDAAEGKANGAEKLAKYAIDRDCGRPIQQAEHVLNASPNNLTDIMALVGIQTTRQLAEQMSKAEPPYREYDTNGVLIENSDKVTPETPKTGHGTQ